MDLDSGPPTRDGKLNGPYPPDYCMIDVKHNTTIDLHAMVGNTVDLELHPVCS